MSNTSIVNTLAVESVVESSAGNCSPVGGLASCRRGSDHYNVTAATDHNCSTAKTRARIFSSFVEGEGNHEEGGWLGADVE
jgi:hypothetical protein